MADVFDWLKENIEKHSAACDRKNAAIDARMFMLDIRLARQDERAEKKGANKRLKLLTGSATKKSNL